MTEVDGTLRKRESKWTAMPNATVEDARLSYKARGILASLLAKPNGWKVRSDAIQRAGKEGREAIRSGIAELVAHGYYRRTKHHGEDGRWWTEIEVSAVPVLEWIAAPAEPKTSPGDGKPSVGKPAAGSPAGGAPHVVVPKSTQNSEPHSDADPFADWWDAYPRQENRPAAASAYRVALGKTTPEVLLAGARRYAAARRDEDPKYTKTAGRWLADECWNDTPPVPPPSKAGPPPVAELDLRPQTARTAPPGVFAEARKRVAKPKVGARR